MAHGLLETLLGEEFLQQPQQVRALLEAQARMQEQLVALAAEVKALAEAQRRTDERLEQLREETREEIRQLREAIAELTEAQRRSYEEFQQYRSSTHRRLNQISHELRRLADHVGTTVEEEVENTVWWVLKEKGYRFFETNLSRVVNGELDVVLVGETPQGESITVLVEGKTRLGKRDVHIWLQRIRSEGFRKRLMKAGLKPPYYPYFFAMRVDPAALEAITQAGIGLVTTKGEVVKASLSSARVLPCSPFPLARSRYGR